MRAVDANLVVRLLVDDDRSQADRAQQIIGAGDLLLLNSVILESAWVLGSVYRLPAGRIASILRGLIGLPGIALESAQTIAKALDWFEAGLDFADAMHLAAAPADAEFVTFDRALVRDAGKLAGTPDARLA